MSRWRHGRASRRILQSVILFGLITFILYRQDILDITGRGFDTWQWEPCTTSAFSSSCTARRTSISKDVQVIVKTGGSEPAQRLQSLLNSLLVNVPKNYIVIFSDLDEDIGSWHTHNVFDDMPEAEMAGYAEFALYQQQLEYRRQGKDTHDLNGGWDLSK